MDRAYTNLLAHLHTTNPSLPLTTIQSALAHYLANLNPLPTPLAAIAISSTLYLTQPFTNEKLQSLSTAFRHAVHIKYHGISEEIKARSRIGNVFSKSLNGALSSWVGDLVKGIQGGHPVLRLSSLSGLLLGIHDLELDSKNLSDQAQTHRVHLGHTKNTVEGELIVAVAETMDTYSFGPRPSPPACRETETQPTGLDVLTLALLMTSHSLPLVSSANFEILPLSTLVHLTVVSLSSAFHSGKFLQELASSITRQGEHRVYIPPSSPAAKVLHAITASPVMTSAASLTRLTARSLRSLLEAHSNSRMKEGLQSASETLQVLRDMAMQVEQDWSKGLLVDVNEHDIAPVTRPITQAIWAILKTQLFSVVMISEAILSSVVYIKPGSPPYTQASTTSSELALHVLHIFSHLSFVISQFGGVTSTSQGFEELKKTFYLALDILAQTNNISSGVQIGDGLVDTYVRHECLSLQSPSITGAPISIQNSKKALVLASIEQLVPALSEEYIRDYVLDVCFPHLSDPSHRETFESAHSVILTVFASRAQQQQRKSELSRSPNIIGQGPAHQQSTRKPGSIDFVKKMVPFYAYSLIENSTEGKLSTPQLRMAYSALVRCAGANGLNVDTASEEAVSLAWYCIQLLLDAIGSESLSEVKDEAKLKTDKERLHRLRLTLISTIPSLPLVLMLRVLEETKSIIASLSSLSQPPSEFPTLASPSTSLTTGAEVERGTTEWNELVKALFDELIERVGYREKSTAMQWWYQNRMEMQLESSSKVQTGEKSGSGVGSPSVETEVS